jgi:Ser/Thr protein kinase RdoA (MazF antagonist)
MLNWVQPRVDSAELAEALPREFEGLPADLCLLPGAGTGNRSFRAVPGPSDGERTGWFVRVRNPKYAAEDAMRFEHDLLTHLKAAGLPVYPPLLSRSGEPWAWIGNACVQLSPLVAGEAYAAGNVEQIAAAARFLSRLHREGRRFLGDPRKQWDREDSFMIAFAGFDLVRNRDTSGRYTADLNAVAASIHRFMRELPPQRFWKLPQSVVHGDFHQGNLLFKGDRLAGVFDWDYACEHPRLKDIANALMFLCTRLPRPLDAADIRTYVQPMRFEPEWVEAFFTAYEEADPLCAEEWAALPAMMVGRWLQIRSCAIIKLPEKERLEVFCDGMAETLERLWSFSVR